MQVYNFYSPSHKYPTVQAFYFERDDVDLKGFAEYFRNSGKEEWEHAQKFMKFQTDRGGRIVLQDIKKPDKDEWGTGQDAMETALALEKTVNQALLDLHKVSDKHNDYYVGYNRTARGWGNHLRTRANVHEELMLQNVPLARIDV